MDVKKIVDTLKNLTDSIHKKEDEILSDAKTKASVISDVTRIQSNEIIEKAKKEASKIKKEAILVASNLTKNSKKEHEKLLSDIVQRKEELDKIVEKINKYKSYLNNTNKNKRIRLNIGGYKCETTVDTLQQTNCMLSAMVSEKYENKTDKWGYYFIDRDGTKFKKILNLLRNHKIIIPSYEFYNILPELEFYCIDFKKETKDRKMVITI